VVAQTVGDVQGGMNKRGQNGAAAAVIGRSPFWLSGSIDVTRSRSSSRFEQLRRKVFGGANEEERQAGCWGDRIWG
jgi:hypothetical protein